MISKIEELGEELCEYCSAYDFGESKQFSTGEGVGFCECSHCEAAYSDYLDCHGVNENIVKHALKIKLINKGDYEHEKF